MSVRYLLEAKAALAEHARRVTALGDAARALEAERDSLRARVARLEAGEGDDVPTTVPEWRRAIRQATDRLGALELEIATAWASATDEARRLPELQHAVRLSAAGAAAAEAGDCLAEMQAAIAIVTDGTLRIEGMRAALAATGDVAFMQTANALLPTPLDLERLLMSPLSTTPEQLQTARDAAASRIDALIANPRSYPSDRAELEALRKQFAQ